MLFRGKLGSTGTCSRQNLSVSKTRVREHNLTASLVRVARVLRRIPWEGKGKHEVDKQHVTKDALYRGVARTCVSNGEKLAVVCMCGTSFRVMRLIVRYASMP